MNEHADRLRAVVRQLRDTFDPGGNLPDDCEAWVERHSAAIEALLPLAERIAALSASGALAQKIEYRTEGSMAAIDMMNDELQRVGSPWRFDPTTGHLSASGAGVDPSQPIIQELRKLPRYWMHIPNAAASSTQVVCWVDVQRVIDQSAGVDRQAPPPWQVIETAPKERPVLVAFVNTYGNSRVVKAVYFDAGRISMEDDYPGEIDDEGCNAQAGWFEDSDSHEPAYWQMTYAPTHWMPLPDPPSAGVGVAPPPEGQ